MPTEPTDLTPLELGAPAPDPSGSRPELPLFALAALALIGCVVLLALHVAVPEFLQVATIAAVTGGAGVATPRGVRL